MTVVAEHSAGLLPPLQSGDRMDRLEFHRRYEAMPRTRAELIEGVVYVSSPVSVEGHATPHFRLIAWLGAYAAATPGVVGTDNGTLILDGDNEVQPDAALYREGGGARVAGGYLTGAPEFIAEVAASSVSIDLHDKLRVYERNGVREYLVWRVWDRAVDWFVLRDGRYEPLAPGPDGILRSEVLPGLWLDVPALVAADAARVQETLGTGLASRGRLPGA